MADLPDLPPLETRSGLPPALRALADELPRSAWAGHARFRGLAEFWLHKHAGFRRLSDHLIAEARAVIDGRLDATDHARGLERHGGMLIGGLHQHHTVEDHHYFPDMRRLDPGMARGFDLLDRDHEALDPWLHRLTGSAREAIAAPDREAVARLLADLDAFVPILARHLEDEEDLIVPVILRTGLG